MTTATTTEKPILFSTELVQAILDGRKSQTRRIIKADEKGRVCRGGTCIELNEEHGLVWHPYAGSPMRIYQDPEEYCPYGYPGNELWVRETWKPIQHNKYGWIIEYKDGSRQSVERLFPHEKDDKEIHWAEKIAEEYEEKGEISWKPSIYLPRYASRIQLKVEDIRVERVQEISEENARAEGIPNAAYAVNAVASFERLWDSINADRGYPWESNPWVWVIQFNVKNIK